MILNFAGWHNHTMYSNGQHRDSTLTVEMLIDTALDLGHTGVGITDHGVIGSHVKAIKYLKHLKEEIEINIKEFEEKYFKGTYFIMGRKSGKIFAQKSIIEKYKKLLKRREQLKNFKLGLGVEGYVVNRETIDKAVAENEPTKFYHFLLIAKNKKGYDAIKKLATRGWENSFYHRGMERMPIYKEDLKELMQGYRGDIIASTACLGSEFANLVMEYNIIGSQRTKDNIHKFMCEMFEIFGYDLFIELQPSFSEEQIAYNKTALEIANHYGLKAIVTTDSHYARKEKRFIHDNFLKSQNAERETDSFYSSTYLMSVEEIREYMQYLSYEQFAQLMYNSASICDLIENFDLKLSTQVPTAHLKYDYNRKLHMSYFKSLSLNHPYVYKFVTSEYLMDRILLQQIEIGLEYKGININDNVILSRLNEELESLWEISIKLNQRLSSYYVLTKEIVDLMWLTSIVGVSRGSAGAFFICYAIGICQINPLQYNLPAWRHISADRPELPDIDLDTQASERANILELVKQKYGYEHVLNICTFKTEGTPSAIQTICRGMQIHIDDAKYLSSLVPRDGANTKTIKECIKEYEFDGQCKIFIDAMREYDKTYEGFLQSCMEVEGLICGRSVHASGIYLFNEHYTSINAMMKAPSGQPTTQFDMADSDYMGGLKLDFLTIEGADRLRKNLELLIKHNKIEYKGSLKATYDAYLHPDVLEYKSPDMWELLYSGELINAFQFETIVGRTALQKVKPHNLQEVITSNSLMRLSVKEGEQPIDRFVRYKQNINTAYEEMKEFGLTDEEITVLKEHLEKQYFIASTQEDVMRLSMDKRISCFSLSDANGLRKAIAKAKAKYMIQKMKKKFFEDGLKAGNSYALLNYVWTFYIEPMLGYAFSEPHVCGYSLILLQELNLAYKYGTLFWQVACLSVNSGALSEEVKKGTDYGAIAKAIGDMPMGFVLPPCINTAQLEFIPLEEENKAMYSLIGINGIGYDVAKAIIDNRPYKSFDDFIERCVETKLVPKSKVYNLIKAGSFDKLNPDRFSLMIDYVTYNTETKNKLTTANIPKLIEYNLIPQDLSEEITLYNFKKVVFNKANLMIPINKSRGGYIIPANVLDYYYKNYEEKFISCELVDNNGNICLDSTLFEKIYKNEMTRLDDYLKSEQALDTFNNYLKHLEWVKNCSGNLSSWEMESICYYTKKHELDYYPLEQYFNIAKYNELPRQPIVLETKMWKKREINILKLDAIAGVVVDKDKNKSTITLNTQYGVVDIKMNKGQFSYYDRSVDDDKSWLTRGNKLLVVGFRSEETFYPKIYKDSPYSHTISKIDTNREGGLILRTERKFAQKD